MFGKTILVKGRSNCWPGGMDCFGAEVIPLAFAPDEGETITRLIHSHLSQGCDLILPSGGMSVNPGDVTRYAIRQAGRPKFIMVRRCCPEPCSWWLFLEKPLFWGCPRVHCINGLDLVLPRILAGERVSKSALALMGHGALCRDCPSALFPTVPSEKGHKA